MVFHGFNTPIWIIVVFSVLYRSNLVESTDTNATITPEDGGKAGMIVMSLSANWGGNSSSQASSPQPNQGTPKQETETSQPVQVQPGTPETSASNISEQPTQVKPEVEPENMTKEELVELLILYTAQLEEWNSHREYLKRNIERILQPPKLYDRSVVLNINSKMSTDLFKYTKENNVDTYIAREGFKFKLIKQYNEVLWHTLNRAFYANKVDVSFHGPATIMKEDGTEEVVDAHKAVIHHLDGKQSEVLFKMKPEENVFLVQLDVGIKHSTKAFVYKRNQVKHRQKFICKPEFLFTKVRNNGKVVWPPAIPADSDQKEETFYSRKVLIDSSDGSPNLRVFFYGSKEDDDDDEADPDYVIVPNPNLSSFQASRPTEAAPSGQESMAGVSTKKQPDVKRLPIPESQILDASQYPSEIKLYVPDPTDPTKASLLGQHFYDVAKPEDHVYDFYLKPGVKCNSLEFNAKQVWAHDPKVHGAAYPSWFSYRHQSRIFVFVSNLYIYQKQSDESWSGRPLQIKFYSLDPVEKLNDVEVTPLQYELKDKPGANEFTFKFREDVNCSEVSHGENVLWSYNAKDGPDFPKQVDFVEDTTIKVVFDGKETLYSLDGSAPQTSITAGADAAPAAESQQPTQQGQETQAEVMTMDQLQQSASQSQASAGQKDGASVDIQLTHDTSTDDDSDSGEEIDFSESEDNAQPATPSHGVQQKPGDIKLPLSVSYDSTQAAEDTEGCGLIAEGKVPDDDDDTNATSAPLSGSFQDVKMPTGEDEEESEGGASSPIAQPADSGSAGTTGISALGGDIDFVDEDDEEELDEETGDKGKVVAGEVKEATETKEPDTGTEGTGEG
ncbi:hypothetical protein MACJ_002654 [Theileria orientalis]|uniref:Uncharacterized protein n=1 Tax=Theileria orientalis TaxID=68886 RepID=A0A976QQN7_THEOR|nr:hypothetical protein MACJ_002654 [Theileria orientalis]